MCWKNDRYFKPSWGLQNRHIQSDLERLKPRFSRFFCHLSFSGTEALPQRTQAAALNNPYSPPQADSQEPKSPPPPPTGCGCFLAFFIFAFTAYAGLPMIGTGFVMFHQNHWSHWGGGILMIAFGGCILGAGWYLAAGCYKWEKNRHR